MENETDKQEKYLKGHFGNHYKPEAPDGYFDKFQKQLGDRLAEKKRPSPYPAWLKPAVAAIAIIAILFAVIPYFKNETSTNSLVVNQEQPEDFANQAQYILSENTLSEMVHSDSLFAGEEFMDDEAIEEYLIQSETDISSYISDLN